MPILSKFNLEFSNFKIIQNTFWRKAIWGINFDLETDEFWGKTKKYDSIKTRKKIHFKSLEIDFLFK